MAIGDGMTVALVGAIALGWTSVPLARAAVVAVVVAVAMKTPVLLLPMALVAGLTAAVLRLRRGRGRRDENGVQLATLCDLATIGLTGGLGVHAALGLATENVSGEVAGEVAAVLRRAQVEGMAAAMSEASGIGHRLYRVVGRAAATGSPLLEAVGRLSDELHADLAAARLQAVRRLPIALLFPLTLLILPGSLLLTVAPAILDAFVRLEI
jgi:Flp pilus assembly protein TadB